MLKFEPSVVETEAFYCWHWGLLLLKLKRSNLLSLRPTTLKLHPRDEIEATSWRTTKWSLCTCM